MWEGKSRVEGRGNHGPGKLVKGAKVTGGKVGRWEGGKVGRLKGKSRDEVSSVEGS